MLIAIDYSIFSLNIQVHVCTCIRRLFHYHYVVYKFLFSLTYEIIKNMSDEMMLVYGIWRLYVHYFFHVIKADGTVCNGHESAWHGTRAILHMHFNL